MDKIPDVQPTNNGQNVAFDEPPPPYIEEPYQPNGGQLPNAPQAGYYPPPPPMMPSSFPPPYSLPQGTYPTDVQCQYPPNGPTRTTVIVTTNARAFMLAPHPVNTQCPHCHAQILTQTTTVAGAMAWLLCAIIFFFGFWLGCCLIPFCVRSCHDVEHRCPQCKSFLGVYRRL